MSFKNKVVLVTGSSSGIGAATAEAFSQEEAHLVMVGRNERKLAAVAARCTNPFVLRADVTKDDDIRRIISETIEKFGKLDILVNNAGKTDQASLLEGDIMETYDTVTNVNLRAVIHLTSLATPYLIQTKGNIINISSILGKLAIWPSTMAYSVSKAGLTHFSACAAAELAPHGIRVNTIIPGPVKTDLIQNSNTFKKSFGDMKKVTALDRISEPKEISDLILFLASDKAKGITGSNFVSDNGITIKQA